MSKSYEKLKSEQTNDIRATVKNKKNKGKLSSKKRIKKIVGLILIICIIILIVYLVSNIRPDIEQDEIAQYNYFMLSQEEKKGIIDRNGNVIVEPTYDYIQIPNPEKPIFICLYDYNSETQSYSSKVINNEGEELYTKYENIMAIPSNNTSNSWSYQTSILKYKENDKYGIITISGKKITDPIYDSIDTLAYKDGILKVSRDEKYGLIKLNGEKVLDTEYYSIVTDGYYNEVSKYEYAGYIVSIRTEEGYRYGYTNYKAKEILDCSYNSIKRITMIKEDSTAYLITHKNGQAGLNKNLQNVIKNEYESIEYDNTNKIIALERSGKYGVYNLYGDMILPIQYDNITFAGTIITANKDGKSLIFDANGNIKKDYEYRSIIPTASSEYYITIDNDGKYGIVDGSGNTLVKNKFNYIQYAFDKYFIINNNGNSGVINYTGKEVLNVKYNVVQNISGTSMIQAIDSTSNISEIYNSNMEKVAEVENAHIYLQDNYIKIISDTQLIYLDFNGNIIESKDILTNNKIFAKQQNGKWGYVDNSGNVVIDYIYDIALDINEYGFGAIKKDGKWGVIDSEGNIIKDITYEMDDVDPTFIGEYYKKSASYEIDTFSNENISSIDQE